MGGGAPRGRKCTVCNSEGMDGVRHDLINFVHHTSVNPSVHRQKGFLLIKSYQPVGAWILCLYTEGWS